MKLHHPPTLGFSLTVFLAMHLCAGAVPLVPPGAAQRATPPPLPKYVIMEGTVTVDGVLRPDLGQSIADCIAAKLIQAETVDVLDPSALAADFHAGSGQSVVDFSANPNPDLLQPTSVPGAPPTPLPSSSLTQRTNAVVRMSAPSPVEIGKAAGADAIIIPTVVGIQNEYRLTLRKLKIPSGRIEMVLRETTRGELRELFCKLDACAEKLSPEKPYERPYDYVRSWITPGTYLIDEPAPQKSDNVVSDAQILDAPKAIPSISPEKQAAIDAAKRGIASMDTAGAEAVIIGRVSVVDKGWSFCEITTKPGAKVLLHQDVFVWSESDPSRIIHMTVTRVDGGGIIADFGDNPNSVGLRVGDNVYHWQVVR